MIKRNHHIWESIWGIWKPDAKITTVGKKNIRKEYVYAKESCLISTFPSGQENFKYKEKKI